jgi:transposase
MLQPVVRRTWAPRGITPVHRSWDRHDRLSTISAITISPKRRQLGLYFQIHRDNIRAPQAVRFIRRLRRQLSGHKLLVVWDRLNVHRTATKTLTKKGDGVRVEWLPPYAPDLNPVEAVWRHAKYADMANMIPDDINHLEAELIVSLHYQGRDHVLLGSYFRHAELPI